MDLPIAKVTSIHDVGFPRPPNRYAQDVCDDVYPATVHEAKLLLNLDQTRHQEVYLCFTDFHICDRYFFIFKPKRQKAYNKGKYRIKFYNVLFILEE